MESTLAGFFFAGLMLVLGGAMTNWWASHPIFPFQAGDLRDKWRSLREKLGPRLWRWGVGVWVAGIVFVLLAVVPLIAWPALIIWGVARIAKR